MFLPIFTNTGYLSPEDQKRIIAEIRRLKTEHWYSDKQIMEALKISKPTLIKYKRMMYEENERYFQEMTREEIAEHIDTTMARLSWIAQKYKEIAETAELDSDKTRALDGLKDLTMAMGKIDTREKEEILAKYGNTTDGETGTSTRQAEQTSASQ